MKTKIVLVAIVGLLFSINSDCLARETSRSGSYSGSRGSSGTFEKNTSRSQGSVQKNSTWQNQKGQGSTDTKKTWNKESKKGTYSSTATTTAGKTVSRSGDIAKTENGGFSKTGQVTTSKGQEINVQKDIVKNEDGTYSKEAIYTGTDGKTLSVDKNIVKTDQGEVVTGAYSSSTGKSGSLQSDVSVTDGVITKNKTLTNQDQKTWVSSTSATKEGSVAVREITVTNPEGETNARFQTVTSN
jgi:hypothetical protein